MNIVKNIEQRILTTLGLAVVASSSWVLGANAQSLGEIEREIAISEVPLTVMSTVRAASGGEPNEAKVQVNSDGTTVYELGGQNQQGFDFEIEITPDGRIIEIDEQIERSAVPEKVMKALKFWLPQAEIVSTWRSTRYTSFDYHYEIVIGEDFWVDIPADASTLKINSF